ncbi:hypothetical protein Hte_005321 [Hypoxylon texense]
MSGTIGPVTPYITNGKNASDLIPPPTTINDTHKNIIIPAWCIVMGIIASITVLARLAYRKMTKNLGIDDFAIIPALILFIGWTALTGYICLNAGVGKPLWEITLHEYTIWYQGLLASLWLYPLMSASIRISILLFYRRIFAKRVHLRTERLIWVLIALQGAYVIVFMILPGFICAPLHYEWDPLQRLNYCSVKWYYMNQESLYSTSFGFDVILLLFPIFPLYRVKMSTKRRIGVLLIFLLGASSVIAAAYRLGVFVESTKKPALSDPFYLQYQVSRYIPAQFKTAGTDFWIPTQVEPTVALIGTSLPALVKAFGSVKLQLSHLSHSSLFSHPSLPRSSNDASLKPSKKNSKTELDATRDEICQIESQSSVLSNTIAAVKV